MRSPVSVGRVAQDLLRGYCVGARPRSSLLATGPRRAAVTARRRPGTCRTGPRAGPRGKERSRGERGRGNRRPGGTSPRLAPLWSGKKGGLARASAQRGTRPTDLTCRLPCLPRRILSPTTRVPRQFSEISRSSWRSGSGGESRGPCIAGTAPLRISLTYIDFIAEPLAGAAPHITPHPAPPGPERRRSRHFRTASSAVGMKR